MTTRKSVLIISLLFTVGCAQHKTGERTVEVQRVFMHNPGVYSGMYVDSEKNVRVIGGYGATTLIIDIPEDRPMWVKETKFSDGIDSYWKYEFHVHSIKEVDGGGWNHGKFGSGQTSVVK